VENADPSAESFCTYFTADTVDKLKTDTLNASELSLDFLQRGQVWGGFAQFPPRFSVNFIALIFS